VDLGAKKLIIPLKYIRWKQNLAKNMPHFQKKQYICRLKK
jgi:hypothetical protein